MTPTMRPQPDDDGRPQDVHLDADHLPADPKVRKAIPAKAPAITWLTRYSPPNNEAKSTVPATTAMPIVKCHIVFGVCRGDSAQLNTTYASTKVNSSSAPNAAISARPPNIISITASDWPRSEEHT